MCSDYRIRVEPGAIDEDFSHLRIPLRFPEGRPNFEPRDDVRITDRAPIVRAASADPGAAELVQRRWSWPGPKGRPVYNFRSDGREFASGRCLIVADGFYEFTANRDPKVKRKHKWLFTLKGERWFCIAGLWRNAPDIGEAFTMLTAVARRRRRALPRPPDRRAHSARRRALARPGHAVCPGDQTASRRQPPGRAGRLSRLAAKAMDAVAMRF